MSVNACVVLRQDGCALVLDLTDGRLPAVVYWGADVGSFSAADVAALVEAGVSTIPPNGIDEPLRLSLLPEHWTGWVGRPGISGSRRGQAWSPKFASTAVTVGGQSVDADQRLFDIDEPTVVSIEAVDTVAQLSLTIDVEALTGGLFRTRARVTNTSPDAYQLDDLVLAFPVPSQAAELLDMAGRWGKERVPQRRRMTVGTHLREGRKGRTGADAATLLHLGEPDFTFRDGEIWAVHTGWSGNHTHYAEKVSTGEQIIGGGELLLPGEVVLEQDEQYTSPWVYAAYGVGLDAVAHRFHRYLRSRPQHPSPLRPVTLNVWEAVYFDHDLARLTELARAAAELGVERYVLDDGWFGGRRDDRAGLGDWTVSSDIWPKGLHPLVDTVTGLGMQFGLWFEPEMINMDSDVARAHPDWVMATGDRLPVESRYQQVINLAVPECYAYIRDAIFAMLDEYDISYLKWDHNRDLIDAGGQPAGRPGVHRQTLALYRLLDEIRAAHPGLEIESCSSGGARVDLGVLERTDRVWVSDCIDPLERVSMHRWTTQLLPPELMGAHIASGRSHTTGRVHDLNFRAATAVFGHLGIEWDLSRASEDELDELRAWIALFKQHRGLLLRGDLVRMDVPDESINVSGVVSADRRQAMYAYSVLARSEVVSPGRIRFPGLDRGHRYRIAPLMVEYPPSGLKPPPWWGAATEPIHDYADIGIPHRVRYRPQSDDGFGLELPGSLLTDVGLAAAALDPEHALIYLAEAVD